MSITKMETISTLILATTKTSDVRISSRATKEIKKPIELLSSIFSLNPKIFQIHKFDEIIICNQNAQVLRNQDVTKYLRDNSEHLQIFSRRVLNMFIDANIVNCNSPNNYTSQIMRDRSKFYYIVQELLDPALSFSFLSSTGLNVRMVDNNLKIIDTNLKSKLKTLLENILNRDDEFELQDENRYYEKPLIDLIDQKYLTKINSFIKNKPSGVFYYIYGEDKSLIRSLIQKLNSNLPKDRTVFEKISDGYQDILPIDDFIILEIKKWNDELQLPIWIERHKNTGKSIIVFHNSSKPAISTINETYIPNYKELSRYHISLFLYYCLPRIFDLNLHNEFLKQENDKEVKLILSRFRSLEELELFVKQLPFEIMKNYSREQILYTLNQISKSSTIIKQQGTNMNKIYFEGSRCHIVYKSIQFEIKANDGPRMLAIFLGNPKDHSPISISMAVRNLTVDKRSDYEAIKGSINRLRNKIKKIESDKSTENLLSTYIKENIKFSQRREDYIISSKKVSKTEWEIVPNS